MNNRLKIKCSLDFVLKIYTKDMTYKDNARNWMMIRNTTNYMYYNRKLHTMSQELGHFYARRNRLCTKERRAVVI